MPLTPLLEQQLASLRAMEGLEVIGPMLDLQHRSSSFEERTGGLQATTLVERRLEQLHRTQGTWC